MNTEVQQLQDTIAALRGELEDMKQRLKKLEEVVDIFENDEGKREVTVECTCLVVRDWRDPRGIAIHLGTCEDGPFLSLHYKGMEHGSKTAIGLRLHDGEEPHIQLRGKDWKVRADMFIERDCGAMAVFSPGDAPGAVMRALPGGGSVAVLQPDGRARGVLMHDEHCRNPSGKGEMPTTELILATAEGKSMLKLHAEAEGGMLCVGHPKQQDGAVIMSRKDGASLMLHGPANKHGITMAAAESIAQLSVHEGRVPGDGAETALTLGAFGSSVMLCGRDGAKRVDLSAHAEEAGLHLLNAEEQPAVTLVHKLGSHSDLSMRGVSKHDGFQALTGKDISSVRVVPPDNSETQILHGFLEGKPIMAIRKDKQVLAALTEGEHGGTVSVFGSNPDKAGSACLSGGAPTGGVVLATPDGTPQLTLDSTDHGGRLLINNDLGFHRISMGVYEESAAIHLNHTGSTGVQVVASPMGGLLAVCDSDGKVVRSMDGLRDDDDDDDRAQWGKPQADR